MNLEKSVYKNAVHLERNELATQVQTVSTLIHLFDR